MIFHPVQAHCRDGVGVVGQLDAGFGDIVQGIDNALSNEIACDAVDQPVNGQG